MATAKKRGGNYRVLVYEYTDESKKRHYKSFTDPDKAKAELAANEYKLTQKRKNNAENLTFKEASDKYIESKSNLLSPATIRGYRIMQRNTFPLLLKKELSEIRDSDIVQRQMNDNAAKYSSKSISNQFGFISAVMNYHNVNINSVTLKSKENKKLLVPSRQDAEKIMKLLENYPEIECQILLALTCSLRQSEIAGLFVKDIDGTKLSVHGAKVPDESGKLVYKPTNKSKAGTRTISMPPFLAQKVQTRCDKVKDGFLFSSTPGWVLKQFKRFLAENSMPPYTIHSLRHCFAAIMHAKNVPDKYVMKMGGWATDNVLKNVYQYTFEDETLKAEEKANSYFENVMQPKTQPKGK